LRSLFLNRSESSSLFIRTTGPGLITGAGPFLCRQVRPDRAAGRKSVFLPFALQSVLFSRISLARSSRSTWSLQSQTSFG
jgi:hypothetical protein